MVLLSQIILVDLVAHWLIGVLVEVLNIHVIAVVHIQVYVLVWLIRMTSLVSSVLHVLLTNRMAILIVLILRVHFTYF